MNRRFSLFLPVAILCFGLGASGAAEKKESSFWKKLLSFTGISASPGQMKSPNVDLPAGGEVWLADLETGQRRKLTEEPGFRSPIFTPDGRAVLLVRSNQLYELQLDAGSPRKLLEIPGLWKLIGVNREATNDICALVSCDGAWTVESVTLADGSITKIPHDPDSRDDRRLLTHLRGWVREYEANLSVFPARQTKIGLSGGTVAWNDVFFKRGDASPINVSQADGYDCSHPSLSPDAKKVVYVKAIVPN
jgi:hypothetical protein